MLAATVIPAPIVYIKVVAVGYVHKDLRHEIACPLIHGHIYTFNEVENSKYFQIRLGLRKTSRLDIISIY